MKMLVINNTNGNLVLVDALQFNISGVEGVRERQQFDVADGELSTVEVSTTAGKEGLDGIFGFVAGTVAAEVVPDTITVSGLTSLLTEEERDEYVWVNDRIISIGTCSLRIDVKDNNMKITAVDVNNEDQPGWIISNTIYMTLLSKMQECGLITKE